MAFNPNADPKDNFGQDLIQVFGPRSARRHIKTLSEQEKNAIIEKVPEFVDTDDLGTRPSFFQVANKILFILKNIGALQSIDLEWCDDLSKGAMKRHASHYFKLDKAHKNNSVQRGIWLRHLLRDILFEFNPSNVLSGLARLQSDGTYNLNNGQHRTVACIILGVREIPVEWIESDFESVDVDQYATDNLHTLSASPYDEFRIQVRRNQVRKAEGRTDLVPSDIICEEIFDIHARYGSRFVEKGGEVGPKECTGVGNMRNYYGQFGADLYERAVGIACSVFSKAPLATANVWGLMTFLKEQQKYGVFEDKHELDWTVQEAIAHKYTDGKKAGMHLDIRKSFREFIGDENSDQRTVSKLMDASEPDQIAAGIAKLCRVAFPETRWAPMMCNGVNIEKALEGFKVMPRKKS